MISKEYLHERFTYRDGELYWKVVYSNRLKPGQLAGDRDGRGYRRVMIGKQHYKMHILIWIMHNGDIPDGIIVDHKDQNKDNNLIGNLRLLSKGQNNLNTNRAGISFDKTRNKWKAQTSIGNKNFIIGRYTTEDEARAAYQEFKKWRLQQDETGVAKPSEHNATTA